MGFQKQEQSQQQDTNFNINIRTCPVCLRSEDVRKSGKKGNVTQYLCKFCTTYFIPNTVYNTHKKIWHDKIFWKRMRLLTTYLSTRD